MRFGVLGPLTVWTDEGAVVAVPGAKVRMLLADLLVNSGRPVSADRLVDDIWADDPPGNPAGTLAAKASQLRRALEDAEPGGRDLVVSPPPGYRLAATDVDALRFRALLASAREATDTRGTIRALTEALALWRGPAFADFRDAEFVRPAIARLEEQRLVAVEELAEARLEIGEYREVAGDLAEFVGDHPLRERLRAAHLRALYGAGRQAEALDSYEDLRHRLADELGLDPSPELVALQRSILGQELTVVAAPDPARVRSAPGNLRAQRTDLIGRDADIAAVRAAVSEARMVTLTGPGGVGKTRLALAAAAALTERFRHGVWLVELAPLQSTAGDGLGWLAEAVARVLGASIDDGDPAEQLCDALADQELLLVLDNCEHLVDRAADLTELLLGAAPGVRVLATSREPLRLPGEDVVAVEPLVVPDRDTDLAELEQCSAVALFVSRAQANAREFRVDADTAEAIATLCRRLDGIPLALELAATRVRGLGIHDMVARLDDRFRLLATGHRGAPPRQQTLSAMIAWSWDLLDDAERTVLRRLAVHAGGCTLGAAEIVSAGGAELADEGVDRAAVADVMARLVDRSLVQTSGRRYRLLESVSAFSLDRLAETGELDAAHAAHRRYYLDLAERAMPELHGADQQRWLRSLDSEDANMCAAMDGFLAAGDAESALRLTNALSWYWMLRGRLSEARRRIDSALALGGAQAYRAPLKSRRLAFAFLQGEFTDAAAQRRAALDAYSEVDDPAGYARAAAVLGFAAVESGDPADLEPSLTQALTVCEALGDRWGAATAHIALAKTAHSRSDLAQLDQHARTAARMFTEIGDRWGRLQATEWLGALAELTGDLAAAAEIHTEALRLAKELDMWGQVSSHLCWLGWIAMQRTDFGQAVELADRAARVATEHGYGQGRIFASVVQAFTARRDGRPEEAERLLRELLAMVPPEADETPLFQPMLEVELGYLLEERGEATAALTLQLSAFDGAQRLAAPRDIAMALAGAAAAAAALEQFDIAARVLGAAAAVRSANGIPLLPAELPDVDRPATVARRALGAQAFDTAHATGSTLPTAEARALAETALP
ncbi:AfsR/SARP family transcriptional regulator [Nocardia cyriacigeorgica]|uniref:AfsR/SARP family transcriptional regulator n=1 Tax=Nocardia cyriacigeorgica TaxID=135487 RepID=A0A6P1DAB5_9NOCA|nr:BTAD domain-containing putative transcriptional regulator [Nocardia cyriacigeorgica]NEW45653.1 AfsR/SARP family transcriptional regulator [Nocardia cyriacigeorgica]NEW51394.1 AfsR/SARP family transcriptional regulator [Nocardia cyriacigeorgica]NEW55370.1 AfsR/SARP family transcriptional regulator [Nocardia cyriacigeorgica]